MNDEIVYEEVESVPEDKVRLAKEQEIINLKASLSSVNSSIGDWKVAKCYEYALSNLEMPYSISELHTKRQAARDRINQLEKELKA